MRRFHSVCKGLCLLLGGINLLLLPAANNPYVIREPDEHS